MRTIEEIQRKPRTSNFETMFGENHMWSFRYQFTTGVNSTVIISYAEKNDTGRMDHVSVHLLKKRTPTWEEMVELKRLCFKDDEEAFQIFPKETEYFHGFKGSIENVLHIWRRCDEISE